MHEPAPSVVAQRQCGHADPCRDFFQSRCCPQPFFNLTKSNHERSAWTSDGWGHLVMVEFLKDLGRDTRGATAVEYGLILALIFLAMVGAVQTFGQEVIGMWNLISDTILASTGV